MHGVAHLGVILQGHLRDRRGVRPPDALEFRKQRLPVVRTRRAASPARRNPRTPRSFPGRERATMAWAASPSKTTRPPTRQGAACTVPICPAGCAWKSWLPDLEIKGTGRPEAPPGRSPGRPASQAAWRSCAGPVAREEQRGREAQVGVGECDQHEPAAGPDVQGVRLERRKAGHRRDGQFLVVVIQPILAHAQVVRRRPGCSRTAVPAPSVAIVGASSTASWAPETSLRNRSAFSTGSAPRQV